MEKMNLNNKIIIASNNQGKLKEFKKLFTDFEVLSLLDLGFTEDIEEYGKTFEQNALIKAQVIQGKYPESIIISDDSGLEVEFLNGEPGIYSARYAGNDSANRKKVLEKLDNEKNRKARMVTVLCVCSPLSPPLFAQGYLEGYILNQEQGENGFGYDTIFSVDGEKSQAQKTLEEKNKNTQRTEAMNNLMKLSLWEKYEK